MVDQIGRNELSCLEDWPPIDEDVLNYPNIPKFATYQRT